MERKRKIKRHVLYHVHSSVYMIQKQVDYLRREGDSVRGRGDGEGSKGQIAAKSTGTDISKCHN